MDARFYLDIPLGAVVHDADDGTPYVFMGWRYTKRHKHNEAYFALPSYIKPTSDRHSRTMSKLMTLLARFPDAERFLRQP